MLYPFGGEEANHVLGNVGSEGEGAGNGRRVTLHTGLIIRPIRKERETNVGANWLLERLGFIHVSEFSLFLY